MKQINCLKHEEDIQRLKTVDAVSIEIKVEKIVLLKKKNIYIYMLIIRARNILSQLIK